MRFSLYTLLVSFFMLSACGKNDFLEPPPLVGDPLPIDIRFNPPSPTGEQPTDIEITVANQGGLDAKRFDMRVEVWRGCCGGTPIFITTTSFENGLKSGEAELKVIPGFVFGTDERAISARSFHVRVFIDPDEELDENIPGSYDGETNNAYTCRDDIVDNQGDVTLAAQESCISVAAPGGGTGIIGVLPKADD